MRSNCSSLQEHNKIRKWFVCIFYFILVFMLGPQIFITILFVVVDVMWCDVMWCTHTWEGVHMSDWRLHIKCSSCDSSFGLQFCCHLQHRFCLFVGWRNMIMIRVHTWAAGGVIEEEEVAADQYKIIYICVCVCCVFGLCWIYIFSFENQLFLLSDWCHDDQCRHTASSDWWTVQIPEIFWWFFFCSNSL